MYYVLIPPEVISGWLYTGPGSGPMLASAAAWDSLAAELHSTAAAYGAVVTGLSTHEWLGAASGAMATAAAPYVGWMHTTATQAEQAGAQARAAAATFEAAHAGAVPPPLIAANRAQLAALVATNILGQNTPAIAVTEAHYAEMWAQDSGVMHAYAAGSASASRLASFTEPPKTTNETGLLNNTLSTGTATGKSAAGDVQTTLSQLTSQMPQALQQLAGQSPIDGLRDAQTLASPAVMVAQNGSYLFSLVNSLSSLSRGLGGSATAASQALSGAAPAAFGSVLNAGGLGGGLSGLSGVTAGFGQAGTLGGLSVPRAWATAIPATNPVGQLLTSGSTLGTAAGAEMHPGMLNGMPMLANAAAREMGGHTPVNPRFDLRPSVIPHSPAAG